MVVVRLLCAPVLTRSLQVDEGQGLGLALALAYSGHTFNRRPILSFQHAGRQHVHALPSLIIP